MSDLTKQELKDLYDRDKDFKEYVDGFVSRTGLSLDEVLKIDILKNYGNYCKEKNSEKI